MKRAITSHHCIAAPHHIRRSHLLPLLLLAITASATTLWGQVVAGPGSGVQVTVDWHTQAEPRFGAGYRYAWNDIHVTSQKGEELATPIELSIGRDDGGGCFTLLSQPITVPGSGMVITFDRQVIMHPSDAERGTSLPNDPKDNCRYQNLGINRALFHHRIDILDAGNGDVIGSSLEEYSFEISRYQILNDVTDVKEVTLDLSPFKDRRITIRTRVVAAYNGRGAAISTRPHISPVTQTTQQDFK